MPFGIELIQFLAEHRTEPATWFFQLFTFIGDLEGYVLVIAFLYVAVDKRLAFRLSVLTLITMSLNHFSKTLIANPRPFVSDGSYSGKWAVSAAKAADLATEYSTPSGHAMAGSAFYTFLYTSVKDRRVRIACILLLLLTGLSRPYLGVHYLEDVLLGWLLGISIALFSVQYSESIGNLWNRFSYGQQVASAVAASLALWFTTRALGGWSTDGQPSAFVSYAGFLTGVVVAYPLEATKLGFDPRSSTPSSKALRYALSVGMIIATLILLDAGFTAVSTDATPLGDLLRYVRYATASVVGLFLAPLVFLKLGLAERIPKP